MERHLTVVDLQVLLNKESTHRGRFAAAVNKASGAQLVR